MPRKANPYNYVKTFLADLDNRLMSGIRPVYIEKDEERNAYYVCVFKQQENGKEAPVAFYTIPAKEMEDYLQSNGWFDLTGFKPENSMKKLWDDLDSTDGYLVHTIKKDSRKTTILLSREERFGLSSITYIDPQLVKWINLNKYRIYCNGNTGLVRIYADNDNWERIAVIAPKYTKD